MCGGSGEATCMMERMERARLSGYDIEAPVDGTEPPKRGFGKGYETFPEEIYTDIDVEKLVHHLKKSGIDVRFIYMYLVMITNMVFGSKYIRLWTQGTTFATSSTIAHLPRANGQPEKPISRLLKSFSCIVHLLTSR